MLLEGKLRLCQSMTELETSLTAQVSFWVNSFSFTGSKIEGVAAGKFVQNPRDDGNVYKKISLAS